MKTLIRSFNNSRLLDLILVPLAHPLSPSIWFLNLHKSLRLRICEGCLYLGKQVHWTKDDKVVRGKQKWDFKHLCDRCFYGVK